MINTGESNKLFQVTNDDELKLEDKDWSATGSFLRSKSVSVREPLFEVDNPDIRKVVE